MKRRPPNAKAPEWGLTYWEWAGVIVVAAEGIIVWRLVRAHSADRANIADGCPDECLGTFIAVLFWAFLSIAWPIVGLLAAALIRAVAKRVGR